MLAEEGFEALQMILALTLTLTLALALALALTLTEEGLEALQVIGRT